MAGSLSNTQTAAFQRDGFLFPVRVMDAGEAAGFHRELERYERESGGPIHGNNRHKVHLLFTWANRLVRHPGVLDAVESLLGPNLICWTTNFFIKEAGSPDYVSWHQDSTYWGLDPADVVTAWVALTDAPLQSGAMKFLPGSHRFEQIPHNDTFHEHNLLTRGQEIALDVDESAAVDIVMKAGEMSLHHIRLVHGSHPNTSRNRRVGLAIRYIPTYVRQTKLRDSAMLVRGVDEYGHFDLEPDPVSDMDEAAIAAHEAAMERQIGAYYSGTGIKVARR